MINLLLKREDKKRFLFAKFLYNDLWAYCESRFTTYSDYQNNSSEKNAAMNAMLAAYHIVLFCGRSTLTLTKEINLEKYISENLIVSMNDKNKEIVDRIMLPDVDSFISHLFRITEEKLITQESFDLHQTFLEIKERVLVIIRKLIGKLSSEKQAMSIM